MSLNKGPLPTEDDMRQAMTVLGGNIMTVDQDFFHKIHNIEGGEKGNKDRLEHEEERLALLEEEEEKKKDTHDHFIDEVMTQIIEDRLGIGDGGYTSDDFRSALREKGAEHYAKDIEDKDDKAEFLLIAARIEDGTATDQDYERAIELSPEYAKDVDNRRQEREQSKEFEGTQAQHDIKSSYIDEFKAKSEITETFTAEVDATGANFQSFSLDDTPKIAEAPSGVTAKEDVFSLDV